MRKLQLEKLEVRLNKEQISILNGTNRIKSDIQKGKAIEQLCKQALYELGANKVYDYIELDEQINIGDLKAIISELDDNLKVVNSTYHVECKSSHTFRNIHKLAIDIKYLDLHNTRKDYIQKTTESSLGWIYFSQSDWIMCYNSEGETLHIIQNYQEVKKNILEKVDQYVEKWKNVDGFQMWYRLGNNNPIHGCMLEGAVKEDTCKFALIVNLMLCERTIERYGGQLTSYKIELIEDNKKALDSHSKTF